MDQAVLLGGEKVYVRVDFVFGETYKFLKQVVVQAQVLIQARSSWSHACSSYLRNFHLFGMKITFTW